MKPGRKESGPDRDRTDDLLNAIQALSQLSYGPLSLSAGRRVRAVPAGRLGNVVVSGALVNQGISAPRRAFTSLAWREVPVRPAAGLKKAVLGDRVFQMPGSTVSMAWNAVWAASTVLVRWTWRPVPGDRGSFVDAAFWRCPVPVV